MKRVFVTMVVTGLVLASCSAHRTYEHIRPGKFEGVVEAVKSPVAKRVWEKGECDLPSDTIAYGTAGGARETLRTQAVVLDQKAEAVEKQLKNGHAPGSAPEAEAVVKSFRERADEARRAVEEMERRDPQAPASELLFKLVLGTVPSGSPAKGSQ